MEMQKRFWALLLMCTLAALPAWAQETRGNINGVISDAQGVIPGANVRISNTETGQNQSLVTNETGYFEAPLLQPGPYRVSVEMPNFKTINQDVVLSVGQNLSVRLTLEVGNVSETVNVTAEAPILDTTSVSSGQNFDRALIEGLPMAANQPILLSKFAQGIVGPTTQQIVLQGQIDGPNDGAGDPIGGVGSFNYSIDGATNAGNNRRMSASPNSDLIQEMRVETSNFDASQGHGTGANISLMTRAGTNLTRGTLNYQYWTNHINSWNPQQKLAFTARPETGKLYNTGHSHNAAFTIGGPVVLPKIVDGRNKLFYFINYQRNYDDSAARNTPTSTVPANAKHLDGDFSDLLTLGTPGQYQIYDPLTVRPDPARPGSFIRTPFANNIIPKDRFMNANGTYKNPLFALYRDMIPPPNQNFVEQGLIPSGNYYQGGVPNLTNASNFGGRIDYNASQSDRIFFRYAGTTFHEQLGDWTYESPNPKYHGLHVNDKTRYSWAYTGNWTKVLGSTVVDTQFSTNRFYEDQQRRGMHQYKPTDVGLPSYLDEFCSALENCMLPVITFGNNSYQGVSNTADGALDATHVQAQSNITSVKGDHTLRGGVDYRLAMRRGGLIAGGNLSSTYLFDNTFTRAADTTAVFPSTFIGPSLASLMLGIPTQVTIGQNTPVSLRNPWYGTFFQDTWRATQNLTINLGLRYEFEDGITESENRWITEFNPDAELAITQLAEAAYARTPIPQVPASQFRVRGGSVYAGASDLGKTWQGEHMLMPRASMAYKLGERTVLKAGYGLFFDTLNAADYPNGSINQTGYTSATTNVASTDFGQSWLLGDPRNGVLPITDPFPSRNGTRFEPALADSLGANAILGATGVFNRENPNRKHARVNRWRVGVQRELFGNMSVEVAYSGMYSDRVDRIIQESYVPESFYSTNTTSRDNSAQTLLQQQVTNPFHIDNFASLRNTNRPLYDRLANNAFFQARTTQRQNLIRAFPQLGGNNLQFQNVPLGIVKAHSLEVTVNRRYSNGLSANMAFSLNDVTENRVVELYDRAPTEWQPSQDARPFRIAGGAVYEFPFGSNKAFLNQGGVLANIVGGWQMGGTFEYQPGALLEFNNLFFNGNLDDIKKDNPEIALQRDGTVDQSKTWFNVDAGFERSAALQPALFQKRAFPFRVDGVRGPGYFLVNTNIVRNFGIGGNRSLQFRVDVQNLFDNVLWQNPNVDPTSTNFGKVTGATNSIMRFFTFVWKVNF